MARAPRILVFDVETNGILSEGVHVTVAVARWMDEGAYTTCIVPSANEDEVLHTRFAPLLDEADAIVAYNGRNFDLQVLMRAHFADEESRVERWAAKLIDPFEVMRATTGSWVKLDELLEANGLPPKTGNGLEAIQWWADGEYERVARYCEADVEALRGLLALEAPLRFPVKRWVVVAAAAAAAADNDDTHDHDHNSRKRRRRQHPERVQEVASWSQLDWHGYVARWWLRMNANHHHHQQQTTTTTQQQSAS